MLLLVDGFGWRFLQEYEDRYPFLARFGRDGVVAKLTSQFPSTTSAHVTTLHTGLPVGTSGIYEWFQLEPSLDAVIAPLLFSFAWGSSQADLRPGGHVSSNQVRPASPTAARRWVLALTRVRP